jgi:hypothetical protein
MLLPPEKNRDRLSKEGMMVVLNLRIKNKGKLPRLGGAN